MNRDEHRHFVLWAVKKNTPGPDGDWASVLLLADVPNHEEGLVVQLPPAISGTPEGAAVVASIVQRTIVESGAKHFATVQMTHAVHRDTGVRTEHVHVLLGEANSGKIDGYAARVFRQRRRAPRLGPWEEIQGLTGLGSEMLAAAATTSPLRAT